MRYILLISSVVSFLLLGSVLSALSEVSRLQKVQANILQLLETKKCQDCDLAGIILPRTDLSGVYLVGANLAGAQLNKANLSGANLQDANLKGADLSDVNLAGADLRGANLIGTIIAGANLAGTKLAGEVVVYNSTSVEAQSGVTETNKKDDEREPAGRPKVKSVVVTVDSTERKRVVEAEKALPQEKAVPEKIVPEEKREAGPDQEQPGSIAAEEKITAMPETAVLEQEDPQEIDRTIEPVEQVQKDAEVPAGQVPSQEDDIQEAHEVVEVSGEPVEDPEAEKKQMLVEKLLDENRCVGCDLSGVDLSGRHLDEADLERANLRGANLQDVDLEEANLKGADLSGADLRNADLSEADLYRANLSGADLTGADFDEALIDSMISTGAIGADLKGAIGNSLSSPFLKN